MLVGCSMPHGTRGRDVRIGLIARGDNGGLGNLTWEFFRHLHPARVLLKNLDDPTGGTTNRGGYYPHRYSEYEDCQVRESVGVESSDEDFEWLASGVDVIYTAEIPYGARLYEIAKAHGVKTVLHVMPELYQGDTPSALWLPTSWVADQFERAAPAPVERVPVPVNHWRFSEHCAAAKNRDESAPVHFYHIAADAMLDRNGTQTLVAAVPHIRSECKLTVIGSNLKIPSTKYVEVVHDVSPRPAEYWNVHPVEADFHVMPRRYAGLSMPVNEAAAAGRMSIMTGVAPQDRWSHVLNIPPVARTRKARMKGGVFDVYSADPKALAECMTRRAENRSATVLRGYRHLARNSINYTWWDTGHDEYRIAFENICS